MMPDRTAATTKRPPASTATCDTPSPRSRSQRNPTLFREQDQLAPVRADRHRPRLAGRGERRHPVGEPLRPQVAAIEIERADQSRPRAGENLPLLLVPGERRHGAAHVGLPGQRVASEAEDLASPRGQERAIGQGERSVGTSRNSVAGDQALALVEQVHLAARAGRQPAQGPPVRHDRGHRGDLPCPALHRLPGQARRNIGGRGLRNDHGRRRRNRLDAARPGCGRLRRREFRQHRGLQFSRSRGADPQHPGQEVELLPLVRLDMAPAQDLFQRGNVRQLHPRAAPAAPPGEVAEVLGVLQLARGRRLPVIAGAAPPLEGPP